MRGEALESCEDERGAVLPQHPQTYTHILYCVLPDASLIIDAGARSFAAWQVERRQLLTERVAKLEGELKLKTEEGGRARRDAQRLEAAKEVDTRERQRVIRERDDAAFETLKLRAQLGALQKEVDAQVGLGGGGGG